MKHSKALGGNFMNVVSVKVQPDSKIHVKKSDILYRFVKRTFDILISGLSLILLSPMFVIIAILIKLDSKGKVIYRHKRIGKNGEVIYLYKFRSMYSNSKETLEELLKNPRIKAEWEENYKLSSDPRITKVGKFLRRSSLDELPQLLNILSGDMSLVGPRPVVQEEIEKYGVYQDKLLSVTPGLTGWWACNGRSCTSYEDRMKLELYYVEHRSIPLDLKIIYKTFVSVMKRNGAK